MITIVLADDEKLIRAGLKKILQENIDIPLERFQFLHTITIPENEEMR